jgi:WD40 repeat protein
MAGTSPSAALASFACTRRLVMGNGSSSTAHSFHRMYACTASCSAHAHAVQAAEDVHCVVWSLSFEQPYDPLVVVALRAVLHVFDVRARRVIGSMRGHGEPITSLSTHPIWPQLVLSTSRDHTVRVWDLRRGSRPPAAAIRTLTLRTVQSTPANGAAA